MDDRGLFWQRRRAVRRSIRPDLGHRHDRSARHVRHAPRPVCPPAKAAAALLRPHAAGPYYDPRHQRHRRPQRIFQRGRRFGFYGFFHFAGHRRVHGLYRLRAGPDLLLSGPGHRRLDLLPPGPRHTRLSRVAHALGAAQCLFAGEHYRHGGGAAFQPPATQFARLRRRAPALSPRRGPRNPLLCHLLPLH